ncbi:cystathionine beta-lyase [Egicoccus halophilus]|uniref:Cystathionine beta-lyase n=1 Tax=Egicoccus halophilus TaxID=1670830 RepID=A0A8J3AAZ0_9ACTN|nr:cystathionine beta-lyase [Egicoccus halophilus]
MLGVVAIATVAVGINLAFGASATAQEPGLGGQWAQDQDLVNRGAQLFGANCALCHGEQGRGLQQPGPQAGPSLIGVGAASVDFMVRSGRMPMTDAQNRLQRGPNRFSEEDTRALVAFVESLAPGEGPDIPDIDGWQEADLSHGLELFTRNCAACHGPTAQGIAVGQRDISSTLDVVPPLEIAEAVRSGPGVMPRFLEDTMSEEDLQAVTAWVMDLREREAPGGWSFGRSGPVAEGAIAIIVGLGLLTIVMYLLGEKAHDEYDEVEEYRGER